MTIRRKKGKKLYYNCSEYEKVGVSVGHTSNRIDEEFLIEHIKYELNSIIERNFDIININTNNDIKSSLENELKVINKGIDEQMKRTNNLMELYNSGAISVNQFKLQNESISKLLDTHIKNKEIIEDKINNLPVKQSSFKKDVENIVGLSIEQWSNSMLKNIIDKININTNGIISIKWNI